MSSIKQLFLGGSSAAAYQIERSLRFNSADSAYLNRTPGSAGNRKTWTWSGWVKRSALGASTYFFGAYSGSGSDTTLFTVSFNSSDQLDISAFTQNWRVTSQVFRDIGAWYHIVIAFDTTQATAGDRIKLYVNGTQVTAFGTSNNPTQNTDYVVNNTVAHYVGVNSFTGNSAYFNGYLADVHLIDGSALTPSSFGETDTDTGVWKPKAYSGSYGTNGFYLKFADNSGTTSTTLGKDSSGNGNNWTPNNFSVTAGAGNDSLVDSPTAYGTDTGAGGEVRGNYATLNPLKINTAANNQFSNGNLNYTVGAYDVSVVSTIGVSTGKWYWEVQWTQDGGFDRLGIVPEDASASESPTNNGIVWNRLSTTNGMVMLGNNVSGSWGSAFSVNDIIMFALDCDNKALYIGQNGTWRNSGSPTSGSSKTGAVDYSSTSLNGKTLFPLFGKGNAGTTSYIANFGQRPFAYTAPSGFKALCTQNLPTPTIGATATTRADDYFNTVLYTGTGSSLGVTGVGFQPDFVWIKERAGAADHGLYDAVRGVQKQLESNTTDAETTETTGLTAFNSDGFTVGALAQLNTNTDTYVAWNWKANGAGSSNTSGTITSTVSANTTAGFSVVIYTGNGTSGATVGHGCLVNGSATTPSMVMIHRRDAVSNWQVKHVSLNADQNLELNSTAAVDTAPGSGYISAISSTTLTLLSGGAITNVNTNGGTYLAYCFAPVAGYSAFGSYTGNGSADGPFVYTGFRPAYILIKGTSSNGYIWTVYDAKRNTYNVVNLFLEPDSSQAETAFTTLDFLSNGIKIRSSDSAFNTSSHNYIYAAFAENPFKYSLAR